MHTRWGGPHIVRTVRDPVVAVHPQCMLESGGSCYGKESCIRRSRFRRCIKSKCQMMTFFEKTEGELEIGKGLLREVRGK